jgi:hypothetical protein
MIKVFFGSNKWFGWAYGSGVLLLGCLYAQVYMTVLGSRWRRSFFDMFEQIERTFRTRSHKPLNLLAIFSIGHTVLKNN